MTTHANPASDSPSAEKGGTPCHVRALPQSTDGPGHDLTLEQIRETVRRAATVSLRASSSGDVLVSAKVLSRDTMATLQMPRDREPPESSLARALGVARLKLQSALHRAHQRRLPQPLAVEDVAEAARCNQQVLDLLYDVWLLCRLSLVDRMIVQGRHSGCTSRELAGELQHIGFPHITPNNVDQRFYHALKSRRGRITSDQVVR